MREKVVVDVVVRMDVTCDLIRQEVGDHQIAFEWPSTNPQRKYVLSTDGLAALPPGMQEQSIAQWTTMALMKVNPPGPTLTEIQSGTWVLRVEEGDGESARFVGPYDSQPFESQEAARTFLKGRVTEGRDAPNTLYFLFEDGLLIGQATTVVSLIWA